MVLALSSVSCIRSMEEGSQVYNPEAEEEAIRQELIQQAHALKKEIMKSTTREQYDEKVAAYKNFLYENQGYGIPMVVPSWESVQHPEEQLSLRELREKLFPAIEESRRGELDWIAKKLTQAIEAKKGPFASMGGI